MLYNELTTASNGRILLPYIVLFKLPIVRIRALEAVVSTRTLLAVGTLIRRSNDSIPLSCPL